MPLRRRGSCLAGVDVTVLKTMSRGSCSLTITMQDSWGLVGTANASVTYPR
jgi:hypothetical protein